MTNKEINWQSISNSMDANKQLTAAEISWIMNQAMSPQEDTFELKKFLSKLDPGEISADELHYFAQSMIAHAEAFPGFSKAVDIVGTGGDKLNTVNISTMSALVVAGAEIPVVKHGNRASSSSSGSADVLEALGVNLSSEISQLKLCVESCGIGFLFAQVFHPSMKYVAPVRKELGIPTVFNYLGPLTNPALVQHSVIGVANQKMLQTIAGVFKNRQGSKTLVARGQNGLDEISICGPTDVLKISDQDITHQEINPEQFGLGIASIDDIRGGNAKENAKVVLDLLNGKTGAVRNAVLLNSAAGIYTYKYFDHNLVDGLILAIEDARDSIDSGKALAKLQHWIDFSNR